VIKRVVDFTFSLMGMIVCVPLFLLIALLIKIDSPGPVLFVQERIGLHFRPFRMYKFRTMTAHASSEGSAITLRGDKRITRIGLILRRAKLDELPQLFNVVKGEMSLVGPRPEVPRYVERYQRDYEKLLQVRPGLTDPASLTYRHEDLILAAADEPDDYYVRHVLPDKIRLSKEYLRNATAIGDLSILLRTIVRLL
jgi:lipopolysaccharide/colanic/teichoic acid biosynthesis glycosyltransferase